ncbi:MAG: hypothetical protein CSA32_00265 [Desulfobulbus propionicus]|nr:MAG: hypothetical protein CSA32_00265 [Desulfobulbus propionicus]
MNIFKFLLTACCLVCIVAGNTSAALKPTEELRPYIDKVIAILQEGDKTESRIDKVNRIMKAVQEGFDFSLMSKWVLRGQWKKISADEQDKFTKLFTELLKYTYVSQISDYGNERVKYVKETVRHGEKGSKAKVYTLLFKNEEQLEVIYSMYLMDEHWRVYDVNVQGMSLIGNYQKQFEAILQKNSFQDLTNKIQEKITELKQ